MIAISSRYHFVTLFDFVRRKNTYVLVYFAHNQLVNPLLYIWMTSQHEAGRGQRICCCVKTGKKK